MVCSASSHIPSVQGLNTSSSHIQCSTHQLKLPYPLMSKFDFLLASAPVSQQLDSLYAQNHPIIHMRRGTNFNLVSPRAILMVEGLALGSFWMKTHRHPSLKNASPGIHTNRSKTLYPTHASFHTPHATGWWMRPIFQALVFPDRFFYRVRVPISN